MAPRPHDLLFLRPGRAVAAPAWCDGAWMARAPLVVRRAPSTPEAIPVGLRGLQRNQRAATSVAAADVARVVTPEMLAAQPAEGELPALAALRALAPELNALGLAWGPAGGVGFWLACGLPVLRADSDLDLLVRVPVAPDRSTLAALCALQAAQACRVDIQLDNGLGGFALAEHARGGKVMLKTARGPLLVDDPWREAA